MDTYQITVLIRVLFVLVMIGLLVLEGVFYARRDQRRPARPLGDGSTNKGTQPTAMQHSLPYTSRHPRVEANDPEIAVMGPGKRAA